MILFQIQLFSSAWLNVVVIILAVRVGSIQGTKSHSICTVEDDKPSVLSNNFTTNCCGSCGNSVTLTIEDVRNCDECNIDVTLVDNDEFCDRCENVNVTLEDVDVCGACKINVTLLEDEEPKCFVCNAINVTLFTKNSCENESVCHEYANCTESGNSVLCICLNGYIGNGTFCENENECLNESHNCSSNGICKDSEGSYSCMCNEGFTGNGFVCNDTNECMENGLLCGENANCTNLDGGYNCTCLEGFSGEPPNCLDVDECIQQLPCDMNASCFNTMGSFNCQCIEGFYGDGKQCVELQTPQNIQISSVTKSGFTVTYEIPSKSKRIEFFLSENDSITIYNSTFGSLTWTSLKPGTEYWFYVVAVYDEDEEARSPASSTYKQITVPNKPTQLSINDSYFNGFQVKINPVDGAKEYIVDVNVTDPIPAKRRKRMISVAPFEYQNMMPILAEGLWNVRLIVTETVVNISGLIPGNQYKISVASSNDGGISRWIETDVHTDLYEVPEASFTFTNLGVKGFAMTWQLMNGAIGYYITHPGIGMQTEFIRENSMQFINLTSGTEQFFEISVKYPVGISSTQNITQYTYSIPPENITIVQLNVDGFKIEWNEVITADFYDISILDVTAKTYIGNLNTNNNYTTVSDLLTGGLYTIKIGSGNPAGVGPTSNITSTTILPPTSLLSTTEVTDKSFECEWAEMTGRTEYEVYLNSSLENIELISNDVFLTTSSNYEFNKIKSGSKYKVRVRVVYPGGVSGFTDTITQWTFPAAPTQFKTVSKLTDGFVVTWAPSYGANRYSIDVMSDGNNITDVDGVGWTTSTQSILSNLVTGGIYTVKVRPYMDILGFGPHSEVQTTTLLPTVENVKTSSPTQSSFKLTWNSQTGIKYYVIKIIEMDTGELQEFSTVNNYMEATARLPGTLYEIVVIAEYPAGNSEYSSPIFQLTIPAEIKQLFFVGVSKFSFTIDWAKVKGADSYHVICNQFENPETTIEKRIDTNRVKFDELIGETKYICEAQAINKAGTSDFVSGDIVTAQFDCALAPCLNGGTCVDLVVGFRCDCDIGFEGEICEEEIDWCLTTYCAGNTSCESTQYKAICSCLSGFEGDGDISCSPYCESQTQLYTTEENENITLHFPKTWSGLTENAHETCDSGRTLGTIKCKTIVDSLTFLYRSYFDELFFLECKVEVADVAAEVNFTEITTEEIEDSAKKLQILTSNPEELSQDDTNAAAELIINVGENIAETNVDITPDTLLGFATTAGQVVVALDFTKPKPPAPTPPTHTVKPPVSPVTVTTVSTTTQSPEEVERKNIEVKAKIVKALSSIAKQITLPENTTEYKIETEKMVAQIIDIAQVVPVDPSDPNVEKPPALSDIRFKPAIVDEATIHDPNSTTIQLAPRRPVDILIPSSLIEKAQKGAANQGKILRLTFFLHKDASLFPSKNDVDWVVSAEIGDELEVKELEEPILIKISNPDQKIEKVKTENSFVFDKVEWSCRYWNFTTSSWMNDGCCLKLVNDTPRCECTHLTNFALIVSKTPIPADVALATASIIGCSLSILGFVATIVLHLINKEARKKRPIKILINICLNLAVAYSIFAYGVSRTNDRTSCFTVAATLHYFMLTSWCWMAIYSLDMYRSLVKVFVGDIKYFFLKMSVVGYGVPVLIVLLNTSVAIGVADPQITSDITCDKKPLLPESTYLADNMCWIHSISLYTAFLLPIGILLGFNTIIFLIILSRLTWKRKAVRSSKKKRTKKQDFVLAFSMSTMLGLTWVFGYFMLISDNTYYLTLMSWLFTIGNSLQGVAVFWLTCIRREDIFKTWSGPILRTLSRIGFTASDVKASVTKATPRSYDMSMASSTIRDNQPTNASTGITELSVKPNYTESSISAYEQ